MGGRDAEAPGDADPILQLSLPGLDPKRLFDLGRVLAPLRSEGVLVFGSGFLTHNMSFAFAKGTPAWATEFDAWSAEAIAKHDYDALIDFRAKARGRAARSSRGCRRSGAALRPTAPRSQVSPPAAVSIDAASSIAM